jgi:soluble cytochrome b562
MNTISNRNREIQKAADTKAAIVKQLEEVQNRIAALQKLTDEEYDAFKAYLSPPMMRNGPLPTLPTHIGPGQ